MTNLMLGNKTMSVDDVKVALFSTEKMRGQGGKIVRGSIHYNKKWKIHTERQVISYLLQLQEDRTSQKEL